MKNLDTKRKMKILMVLPFLPLTILLSRRKKGHPLEDMENLSFKAKVKLILMLPLIPLAMLILLIKDDLNTTMINPED